MNKNTLKITALNRVKKLYYLKYGAKNQKKSVYRSFYIKEYGLAIPLNTSIDTFLISEYLRPESPIFKDKKLPVVKRVVKGKKRKHQYTSYLKSKKWINFKNSLKIARGNKCEKCGKSKCILHGHHLTYKRFMNELPEDILIVCEDCHSNLHKRNLRLHK